jgi:hypothetical protein
MVFIRYLNSQTAKKPKLPQIKASQKPFNRDLQFFDWLLLKKKVTYLLHFVCLKLAIFCLRYLRIDHCDTVFLNIIFVSNQ